MVSGLKNIETIESPFRRFVTTIGVFPTAFTDAMTYYECLAYLVKYLDVSVVPAINENAEALKELQDYVVHYFDNLDVQDEINNKLDQMAEDGTLQEIITSYIQNNVTWTFDTVADMQAATNLIAGSDAQTLGYYSIDDGGKSLYHISDSGVADGGKVISLSGGLYAHLVVKDDVFVEQFGAKGDGTTDDQSAINKAMQSGAGTIKFVSGKTYAVKAYETGQAEGGTTGLTETTGIVVPSNKIVDINFATIKVIPNSRQNYNVFTLTNVHDIVIKNGNITGDVNQHTGINGEWGYGVSLRIATNITLENLTITKCWGDGINLNNDGTVGTSYNTNIKVHNCICDDNRRQGMSIENARGVDVYNCKFVNTGKTSYTAPGAGIDIEPMNDTAHNIRISACTMSSNEGSGIVLASSNNNVEDVTIDSCLMENNKNTSTGTECYINGAKKVKITNNTIIRGDNSTNNITLRPDSDILFENNTVVDYRIAISCFYNDFTVFYFRNNYFKCSKSFQYNSLIEGTPSSNSDAHGKLIIDGNTFENTSDSNTLNIRSWVGGANTSKIGSIVFTNNYVKGGRIALQPFCSLIMRDNILINVYDTALMGGTVDRYTTFDIQNNTLVQCNFNSGVAGIFNIANTIPFVIRNNTYYKFALDNVDAITYTPAITRWVQSDQHHANSIEEYNNIIANS